MLKSSLCNHFDAYVLIKGTITVVVQAADTAKIAADKNNKKVIFKNCTPVIGCVGEINKIPLKCLTTFWKLKRSSWNAAD